jgi:hypothetical protein
MDHNKGPLRRVRLGEVLHFGSALVFVAIELLLIFTFQLVALAFVLVLLSKWRVFAVRPRYWLTNIKANLVDTFFLFAIVALMVQSKVDIFAQIFWAILFVGWQLILKSRTSQPAMVAQAGVMQFVALTALLHYCVQLNSNQVFLLLILIGAWLIGYAAARHVLTSYDSEEKTDFFALLWGLCVAQLAWLLGHWTIEYDYQGVKGIEIPQIAVIMIVISFVAFRAYNTQRAIREVESSEEPTKTQLKQTRLSLRELTIGTSFAAVLIAIILITTRWSISI